MADAFNFTGSAVKRTFDVVRRVENTPRSLVGKGPPRQQPIPFMFRRFELRTALAAQGSAEAYILTRDADSGELVRMTTPSEGGSTEQIIFTVRDFIGWTGSAGDKGYSIKMHDLPDDWEVIAMECA